MLYSMKIFFLSSQKNTANPHLTHFQTLLFPSFPLPLTFLNLNNNHQHLLYLINPLFEGPTESLDLPHTSMIFSTISSALPNIQLHTIYPITNYNLSTRITSLMLQKYLNHNSSIKLLNCQSGSRP